MKNRRQFKGTEWRNWLLYYSVPCLQGLFAQKYIKLFELLSHPTFLLSQDIVLPEDRVLAEHLYEQFLIAFQEEFGVEKTRLNMHASLHASKSVRNWGPLFNQSTFGFESWNMKIMALIKSPNGAAQQVITRHMLSKLLQETIINEQIPEEIRNEIQRILLNKNSTKYRHVRESVYVMGEKETRTSQEEAELLRTQDPPFDPPNLLRVHKKALIKSVKYCSEDVVKKDNKSNNSLIYTHQNTFCTIKKIVTFQHNGSEVCGMFVSEHTVQRAFTHARHIALLCLNQDINHFIVASKVRVPAVKFSVLDRSYLIPLPNTYEID